MRKAMTRACAMLRTLQRVPVGSVQSTARLVWSGWSGSVAGGGHGSVRERPDEVQTLRRLIERKLIADLTHDLPQRCLGKLSPSHVDRMNVTCFYATTVW